MAAVYLHNQIYAQNSSEARDILEHTRNFSTVSSATLLTNTTLHSQPTEPLLHAAPRTVANSDSYFTPGLGQSRNTDGQQARLRWDDPPALDADLTEKRWQGARRNPARWKHRVRAALKIVIAVWAIYNTIRYFIAFPIYGRNATEGQSFSFALGTTAGVSVALSLCAQALFLVKHKLAVTAQAFKHLTRASTVLNYLSSLFILSPAIINLALIFVWRNSSNSLYNIHSRCHYVEVDIVWSTSHNPCTGKSSSWGIWLTLSFIRLALTLLVLIIYHILSTSLPDFPRRPQHFHLRSESYPSTGLTQGSGSSAGIMLPATPTRTRTLAAQHQISDSTLAESSRPPSRLGRIRSQSSVLSSKSTPSGSLQQDMPSRPGSDEGHSNDHFQSLINQIAHEADEAMEFASSDHAPSPESTQEHGGHSPTPSHPPGLSYDMHNMLYDSDDDDDNERYRSDHNNIFNLPPVPPALGYNEFGLPYPPDEDMRILNGYIRRMPTIESMGSGEITASITGSTRLGGSISNSSRPPTRNTLLSFTSSADHDGSERSAPPSRTNSLSARAELLAGMLPIQTGSSEHGEILGRPEMGTRLVSSPTTFLDPSAPGDTYSSSGSRTSTVSYHTATMGSSSDSYPPYIGRPKS